MPATSTWTSSKALALGIPAERQGEHRQVADLAHAGRRPAHLCAQANARDRARPHRALSCALPPAIKDLLDETHRSSASVYHINCHSMRAVAGKQSDDGEGACAPISCSATVTAPPATRASPSSCARRSRAWATSVKVNDPYKGVELVRAYSDPKAGRHSLQIEINKRLYMDETTLKKTRGFRRLQRNLGELLKAIRDSMNIIRSRSRRPISSPTATGNAGVDYVHVLDSGKPGPNVMVQALTHGNEFCGAIALDYLFRRRSSRSRASSRWHSPTSPRSRASISTTPTARAISTRTTTASGATTS